MELSEATDIFVAIMSSPSPSKEEIEHSLGKCYDLLDKSSEADVAVFMKRTAMICGALVENGFPGKCIIEPFINFYESILDKSRPFYELFFSQKEQFDTLNKEEDGYDAKLRELFDHLINDRSITTIETHSAVADLNNFYLPAISFFSVNKEHYAVAKKRLAGKVAFVGSYSMGSSWINTLFQVLFDEPVVVIDIDRMIGFSGIMNGIVDNYGLQHLLMGLPFLNDNKPAISEEALEVVNGKGPQTGEGTVVNKWNMYHLGLCQQAGWKDVITTPARSMEYRNWWVWSEGTPADIPKHNGYRVVLLGAASYSRIGRVQRIFKNLKSDIRIEHELSLKEINDWLHIGR